MPDVLPSFLKQGERSRLFPVLSTTSKEGRTTSIVLACLEKIDEFSVALLGALNVRVGKRSKIQTFTEIVFSSEKSPSPDRPDGLIVVKSGSTEWRALVEAKVGTTKLSSEQIERYRQIAREHDIDCVITISNQFATSPTKHPLHEVRKSRSRVPVYHWSWMHILTTADLLINNDAVSDSDQNLLLNELRRFLSHESAGVRGFERMPPEWTDLNKLISSGGKIPVKSTDAETVIEAWHQETRDLSLILSRLTETAIHEKLSRKHKNSPTLRQQDELTQIREHHCLSVTFEIAGAAAPIDVVADLNRRCVDVGMSLRAPDDRKSSRARLSWLLRQIRTEKEDELFVRLKWPGRSEDTQFAVTDLRADPMIIDVGKERLQVVAFHLFQSRRLGPRFVQQQNFITDLEAIVPEFYANVGSNLLAWKPRAPRIKSERDKAEDVEVEAIAKQSNELRTDG